VTRDHADIDLFAWSEDGDALVQALAAAGYRELGGPPPAEQRNLAKAGEELHLTLLARNGDANVVTAGGRWDATPWPEGMLGADRGRIGGVEAPIVSPASQLQVKETYASVIPERPLRPKDAGDIERLRAALRR
jgi:hypothetical protein